MDLPSLSGWSLSAWETDPVLAGVRDQAALMKLPDAERVQWQRLWGDVAGQLAADPLQQGFAHAARRDWSKAADCYTRALKLASTDAGHFWFEYAAVLLLSGNRLGYADACADMVKNYGRAPNLRAYHVARACTLAPDAVAEASLPGRLAETELKAFVRPILVADRAGGFALPCRPVRASSRSVRAEPACRPRAGSGRRELAMASPGTAAPREVRGGSPLA